MNLSLKENNMNGHRHGDVGLLPVDSKTLEEVRKISGDYREELTIALGEATGHHHTLYPAKEGKVRLVELNGRRFIDVGAEYFLRHQEHKEQRILPGVYEIVMEKEYDPLEKAMRKVVD